MPQTTDGPDYAAFMRLRLGFDPREAVAAGIRRGWIVPAPPTSAGEDCVSGYQGAAEFLGVSISTVTNMVNRGKLIPIKLDNGRVAFDVEHLTALKGTGHPAIA